MARYLVPMARDTFVEKMHTFCLCMTYEDFFEDQYEDLTLQTDDRTGQPYTMEYSAAAGFRNLLVQELGLTKALKDLSKVEWDWENCETEDYPGETTGFMGVNVLPNGMPYLGVMAGGDWEMPVYFIIYHDGKHFRGYVPKDGNTYNLTTKTAYGNDEEADEADLRKHRGIESFESMYDKLEPDYEKLKADIMTRIQLRQE